MFYNSDNTEYISCTLIRQEYNKIVSNKIYLDLSLRLSRFNNNCFLRDSNIEFIFVNYRFWRLTSVFLLLKSDIITENTVP